MTGASDGLAGIPRSPGPFGITLFNDKIGFYYLVLGCLCGAFIFCRSLVRSPFGAVLRGIRENEAKTRSLGYNTRHYKIAVVAISFALGGLAGALYAPFAGFTNTELLFWLLSGQVLIMVIVGGAGTLIGPIIGAVFFMLVSQPAEFIHRFLGAVLRPDLHLLRAVHAAGHLGPGYPPARRRRAPESEGQRWRCWNSIALTRRFGGIVAVDDVSMRVEAGEVRAVIGPNGAGKSTLFHLITGVVKPTAGEVRFAGESLTGMPPHEYLPARHVPHLPAHRAVPRDDGAGKRPACGAGA